MSKIAVVFHGIVGGVKDRNSVGESIDFEACSKLIKNNILDQYDCDVFMHSWSTDVEEELVKIYKPKVSSFQTQEHFGYDQETAASPKIGQAFRTTSKYTSLERALELKKSYENEHGFKYDWVLVLRFDLVIFTKLSLEAFDNSCFYLCSEPHWAHIAPTRKAHDIVFLSNSENMDEFGTIIKTHVEIAYDAHLMVARKLQVMFKNNIGKVQLGFARYKDMEIYRFINNPELNPVGHQHGALEASAKFKEMI